MNETRTSADQKGYLTYIQHNPGCTRAACVDGVDVKLHKAQAYAAIARLIRRGFVHLGSIREQDKRGPAKRGLHITDKGWRACAG